MKYQVVYFTRTGTSKRVAEKIAHQLSCSATEIEDDINWKGPIGFIKGGYFAAKNKSVSIKTKEEVQQPEEWIVVSPLWAGKLTPAIDAFLKDRPKQCVHLVVTSKGSTLNNRDGFKSVTDIIENKYHEDEMIQKLIELL